MEQVAVAGAVGAASAISLAGLLREDSAVRRWPRGEVVSFHMDRLYLDATGTAAPYHPPPGARSAAPVAHLAEDAFRSRHCYV